MSNRIGRLAVHQRLRRRPSLRLSRRRSYQSSDGSRHASTACVSRRATILKCISAATGAEAWKARGYGEGTLGTDMLVVLSDRGARWPWCSGALRQGLLALAPRSDSGTRPDPHRAAGPRAQASAGRLFCWTAPAGLKLAGTDPASGGSCR